ncbi:dockerin type I repeat-containing protein [Ruminococcus flavefaciens]|uniref:dockerin type I repeat-containing protein n=1 Tax=Ruminococcus flavefaciens TaxID=1265 RepID=UPI0004B0AFF7|nr:dockerin type I repeat-containing protein [Ruminococcus flavefaciens]
MKKLISSTISFITSAALFLCGGLGSVTAASNTEYTNDDMFETEFCLGDIDELSMELPSSPAVLSNYSSGTFNYVDQLDRNNTAVYNAFKALNEPTVTPITVKMPETITVKLSSMPTAEGFTDEDMEAYQLAIFGNCKPGIDAALFDRPELYWVEPSGINISLDKDSTSTYNYWTSTYTVKIRSLVITPAYLNGFSSLEEAKEYGVKLDNAVESLDVSGDTRYAKLKKLHDHISYFTYYDTGARFSNSALGALVEPGVVCEGYSEAFKLICDKLGIPCICVFGNLIKEENAGHMWNYVKMEDDKWYAIDVTWDDIDGENGRQVKYDYFLKGSKSFFTNHTPENDYNITHFEYPELSESNYVLTSSTTSTTSTTTSTTTTTTTTTTTSTTSKTTTTTTTTTTTSTTTTTTTTSTTTSTTSTTSKTTTSTTTSTTTTKPTTTSTTSTSTTTTTSTTSEPQYAVGDLNHDGKVNVADLVYCQQFLLGKRGMKYSCDCNGDGVADIFDLIFMRKLLI